MLLSIFGGIAKGIQWRDNTGKVHLPLLISGICTCLVLAMVIRAAGVHYGIEAGYQVAAAGVLCYVGPDPIVQFIAGVVLKRFGVTINANPKPAPPPGAQNDPTAP